MVRLEDTNSAKAASGSPASARRYASARCIVAAQAQGCVLDNGHRRQGKSITEFTADSRSQDVVEGQLLAAELGGGDELGPDFRGVCSS